MRRYLKIFILLSILFLLLFCPSCVTTKDKSTFTTFKEREKKKEAVRLLSQDMISFVSESSFSPSLLEEYLPSEYAIYKEYVVTYNEEKNKYLENVSSLFPLLREEFNKIIEDEVRSLSMNPEPFTSLSLNLWNEERKLCSTSLFDKGMEILGKKDKELDEYFSSSFLLFTKTKGAYDILNNLDIIYSLPEPLPLSKDKILECFISFYFEKMKEGEEELKNTKVDSSSLYYVFWEE